MSVPESPTPDTPNTPEARAAALLKGYPAGTAEAAAAFIATKDPAALAAALNGVLRHHQPPPAGQAPRPDPASAAGTARLVDDLGIDSLAMVEMTFLLTDLWGVNLSDDELRTIATLDDLRNAILGKVTASG